MKDLTNIILDNIDKIILVLIITSIVIFVIISIFYYYGNEKRRDTIQTVLSMFGNFILILNLMFIIFDKFLARINQKTNTIKELSNYTTSSTNLMFTTFYKDPKNLGNLHSEIFEKKYNSNPKLTYEETNFLFIIFQIIENVYRLYYISGKETIKISKDQYEGWDNFLISVMGSPKVQLFYKKYHHLFTSLNFEDYMKKYFSQVKIYVNGILDI